MHTTVQKVRRLFNGETMGKLSGNNHLRDPKFNRPSPFNYRRDEEDDSSELSKKKSAKKRVDKTVTGKKGKQDKVQISDPPIGDAEPETDNKSIQIGLLGGWNEQYGRSSKSRKTFEEFMQNMHESKKKRELTQSQKRSAKIKRLQDTDQWPNLE